MRSVQYNLSPGSYTFKVKSRNIDGIWTEKPAEFSFEILPPFWKTGLFLTLASLSVIALVMIVIFRLKRQTIILDRKVKKRTAELEIKIHELETSENKINKLEGLLPICSHCKKIKVEEEKLPDKWIQIENYIQERSDADFSHGICPECRRKLYPELFPPKNNNESE